MTPIVDLATYRKRRVIAPPVRMAYSELQNEHARKIEKWFAEMEAAMEGNTRPSDTEE